MAGLKGGHVDSGRALEYAVASVLARFGSGEIENSKALEVAKKSFERRTTREQRFDTLRAKFGIVFLGFFEKNFRASGLIVRIMPDQSGEAGDVRDVVATLPDSDWEVGFSVKRNHEALKHSRLSKQLDFGEVWGLGASCSQQYKDEIRPVFERLEKLKAEGKNWEDLGDDKFGEVYLPILQAFKKEISRICLEGGQVACSALVHYLLGKNDFYKFVALDHEVVLQSFNINGSLAEGDKLKLPTKLTYCDLVPRSNGKITTVEMIFDNGWQMTFRIHSARKEVESSLKFDIQLQGMPKQLYTHHIPNSLIEILLDAGPMDV